MGIFLDCAAVSAGWLLQQMVKNIRYWRLDNHLLTLEGVKEQILVEIVKFFQLNDGSASVLMVCEAFKVYACSLLISLKSARAKKCCKYRKI